MNLRDATAVLLRLGRRRHHVENAYDDQEGDDDPAPQLAAVVVPDIVVRPDVGEEESEEADLRPFVNAFERCQAAIRVEFREVRFRGSSPDRETGDNVDRNMDEGSKLALFRGNEADRLFGSVLPTHPSVQTLRFNDCEISFSLLRSFLAGLGKDDATIPALSLAFEKCILGRDGLDAIASALRDDNVRLELLRMDNCFGIADATGCREICDAASRNRNLVELRLRDDHGFGSFEGGCLDGALGRGSSIRRLHLTPRCSPQSPATPFGSLPHDVIRLLKTNVGLESLTVRTTFREFFDVADDSSDGLLALLQSYNFTLRHLEQRVTSATARFLPDDPQVRRRAQDRIRRLLERNALIREDYVRSVALLESAAGAHYSIVRRLWPDMIQRFNAFPTLIYRFLRPNVEALASTALLLVRGNDRARVVVGLK